MKDQIYTELLASHKDRIYRQALYSLRNADDAEDVTQEVFLKLWDRFDQIAPEKIGAWLTRVTHNLCIDQARRQRAQRTNFGRPDTAAVDRLVAPPGPFGDSEHRLRLSDRQRALLAAMTTLTPETRGVMIMHYFQDLKLHEISEILGKSVSALKVQIHRARKSLRLVLTTAATDVPSPARRRFG